MREGVANYALSSDASGAQRFRGVVRRVFDLTLARNERELQVSEPALVLLFEGEPHKDHAALKIGEIVRDEAGGFTLAMASSRRPRHLQPRPTSAPSCRTCSAAA
jgi:predicted component of type VI protein secretion system